VHGWWNIGGAKMSKSVGNIIDPFVLADQYSADAVRYYLMSDIATGKDADFSEERLVERYNADLGNSLGNLLNRTLNMVHRYRNGRLSAFAKVEFGDNSSFAELIKSIVEQYSEAFVWQSVNEALEHAIHLAKMCNLQIEVSAPWKLAKEASNDLLDRLLYGLIESLRIIAILISPVLPKAAHGIFDQLNWKMELSGKEERFSLADAEWGRLPDGHVVGKPVPLFPRDRGDEIVGQPRRLPAGKRLPTNVLRALKILS
jgi:methionyl-tRNA synthetase